MRMRNTAVYFNEQDYRIFVSFRGQSLQLAGIDDARFSSCLRCASSSAACKVSLSSELWLDSTCFRLPAEREARFITRDMSWPLNFYNIIKTRHNPATIWRDARCKGQTSQISTGRGAYIPALEYKRWAYGPFFKFSACLPRRPGSCLPRRPGSIYLVYTWYRLCLSSVFEISADSSLFTHRAYCFAL